MKKKSILMVLVFLSILSSHTNGQTPVTMATQSGLIYTENFSDIANWTDNFLAGTGANRWTSVTTGATGTIPDGIKTTLSTSAFVTGTSGGVQRGGSGSNPAGIIVLLSTGSTDNSVATAIDFFLDFSGVKASSLSFDWASVNNSTGDRKASLRVYTSSNGSSFTELTSAQVLNFTNNSATSGSITNATLPSGFDNCSTARIRFYEYNGTGGTTGSRPKISFDNVSVSSTLVAASNVTLSGTGSGTSAISWTAPSVYNNSYNETVVFLKDGSAIAEGTPSNDIAGYTANTAFGSGTAYQNDMNAFCIYKGDGISVDITNITNGHTYYALVYNTNGSTSYSSSATNSAALPVELTSFKLSVNENKVTLNWTTATEVNNYGFEILRRVYTERSEGAQNDNWVKVGFVQGHGNSNSPKNYSFIDEPTGGKEFQYRLKQIDFNGAFEYSEITTAILENVSEFKLDQNYPNPFNPMTRISYTLPVRTSVKLRVYDLLAQVIAELVNGIQEAGRYEVTFDGSNLPSGAYFYKLEAGSYIEVKKLLLVK